MHEKSLRKETCLVSSVTKDLRKKSNDELANIIIKLKAQLLEIRFSIANGEQEKLHVISEIKKTIARALTILNERDVVVSINKSGVAKQSSAVLNQEKDHEAIEAIRGHELENLIHNAEEEEIINEEDNA